MPDLLIRLPWPPSKTSPNKSKQGNWWEKSGAAKSYKATCLKECLAQGVRKQAHEGNVAVTVTYYPPTNARMDWDNAANRCKASFDAVAIASGIDDGRWWPVMSMRGEKVKGGAVLVQIHLDGAPWVQP